MKLFYQFNKILVVIATLCIIFIVIPGINLAANGKARQTVLYNKNDCKGKLVIQEEGGTISIRSKEETPVVKHTAVAEFHPGEVAKLFIE